MFKAHDFDFGLAFSVAAGMDGYVSKSIRPQELFKATHRLFPEIPEDSISVTARVPEMAEK